VNERWRAIAARLALLLLFAVAIRIWPAVVRPASSTDDCEQRRPNDVADVADVGDVAGMERCLALRGDDIELMVDLAAAYERSGRSDRAAEIYTRALSVDPTDNEVRAKRDALQRDAAPGRR
jgi:cytochrome c-type biogenesis protein CcmH/NrfG